MTYNTAERATLLALMAKGREVANKELKETFKIDLKAPSRAKLNRDRMIVSRKRGRGFVHELTDRGWAWTRAEFTQAPPVRSGTLVTALYAVLATLGAGLDRRGLTLADLVSSADPKTLEVPAPYEDVAPPLTDRIKAAYRRLAKGSHDWVYLSDLRPLIAGADKAEFDGALKNMYRDRVISLTLEEDQKLLTSAQRAAAIRIGADDMHLIAME